MQLFASIAANLTPGSEEWPSDGAYEKLFRLPLCSRSTYKSADANQWSNYEMDFCWLQSCLRIRLYEPDRGLRPHAANGELPFSRGLHCGHCDHSGAARAS